MNKKYLWRLLTVIMVAMLSVGFASCSGEDDEDDPKTEKTDYGKDGLKGYWMGDTEGPCGFFYLDGEGGGTNYSSSSYSMGGLSNVYRLVGGEKWDYRSYTEPWWTVKDDGGKTYTLYYNVHSNRSYTLPLIYTRTGSTITIIVNADYTFMVNGVDGSISGYKRVTIVN